MGADLPDGGTGESTCDIPQGWVERPLNSLLEPNGLFDGPFGSNLKTSDYTDSGVRVIRLENVGHLRFVGEKSVFISTQKYSALMKHTVGEGDIIFGSFVEDNVRVCLLPRLDTPAIAKADCYCVRPKRDLVDPRFLAFQLATSRVRDELISHIHGATRPRITTKQLRDVPVLLCPLPEQRRIVAKVEALLARVNAARDRLARVPAILKRFRQSVLAAACFGRLTADCRGSDHGDGCATGWRLERLGDLVQKGGLFDGPFGSSLKTDDYTTHGVRVIRLENVGQLRFIDSKTTFVSEEKYRTLSRHTVRQGDIIFASFIESEVRACVLPPLPTLAIAKADCFCIRPAPELVDHRFLAMQLVSSDTHAALLEEIHGATRPRINTRQLRELSIRVCAIAEQREIVRRVEALFAFAATIEQRAATALRRADRLTQSILSRALLGDLVPPAQS